MRWLTCRIVMLLLLINLMIGVAILVGGLSNREILTGSEEVNGKIYLLYLQDNTHNLRIELAGMGCFVVPPPVGLQTIPDAESPQSVAVRRFYMKYTEDVEEWLSMSNSCR